MFDKNDPEIKKYVEEILHEERTRFVERIVEKYAWAPFLGPSYADIERWTGLSEEEIRAIADKRLWKCRYKRRYEEAVLAVRAGMFQRLLEMDYDKDDLGNLAKTYSVDPADLETWRENPLKYAVLELVKQGVREDDIMRELKLTEDQYQALYPTQEELSVYESILKAEEPSEEDAEEAYQDHLRRCREAGIDI